MADATLVREEGIRETASATVAAGELKRLSDGRAAVRTGLKSEASGAEVNYIAEGVFKIACAAATTFAVGDSVFWDDSGSLAIAPTTALDGSADYFLGVCVATCGSSATTVQVDLNVHPVLRPIVWEFDCETTIDTTAHVLIPAEQNTTGLVITHIFGLVTEAMVGSSEDQGIITVSDESNNALCTLTASNSAADVIGDYILGVQAQSTATGAATILQVAAGEYVDAIVTQATSGGTPAGKIKVYIEAIPLV